MHAKINNFGNDPAKSPVRELWLYRLPNGNLLVRLDLKERWSEVQQYLTYTGQYEFGGHEVVHLSVSVYGDDGDYLSVVDIVPDTREEVVAFAGSYFLENKFKHRVHYHVVPKIPADADPEELKMEEVKDVGG